MNLKKLSLYTILNILSYFEFKIQIDENSRKGYLRYFSIPDRNEYVEYNTSYGGSYELEHIHSFWNFGVYCKRCIFLWKTVQLKITRTFKCDDKNIDSVIDRDHSIFLHLLRKVRKLYLSICYDIETKDNKKFFKKISVLYPKIYWKESDNRIYVEFNFQR